MTKKLLSKHFRKIIRNYEEWLDYAPLPLIGDSGRNVDIVVLDCEHIYWQEKGGDLDNKICESCLQDYLIPRWGTDITEWIMKWGWWRN